MKKIFSRGKNNSVASYLAGWVDLQRSAASNSGQVLLVVVLTMIVALTVGLSIASRTILNLKLSKQNEESQKAFSAAEAGIEFALVNTDKNSISGSFNNGSAEYKTTIQKIENQSTFLLNGGNPVDQDAGIDVWLSSYPNYDNPVTGTITLYWSDSTQSNCSKNDASVRSALEVVILSNTVTSPVFSKYIFDPCSRIQNIGVVEGAGSIDGTNFAYSAKITVTKGLIMKVIPVYNSTKVGLSSTVDLPFPSQGSLITSTGTSGETAKKIVYFSSYPQIPLEIFPYSLIAQ